jgi:hypothetical protein
MNCMNSVLWSSTEWVGMLPHQGCLDTVDTDALFLPGAVKSTDVVYEVVV